MVTVVYLFWAETAHSSEIRCPHPKVEAHYSPFGGRCPRGIQARCRQSMSYSQQAKPTRLLVVLYHALTLLASSFSYTSPPSTKSPKMNNLFHHPSLSNVLAKATFPPDNQLAHVVNGERNKLLLSLANTGKENYTLLNAAASYHDPARQWALVSPLSRLIPGASSRIACC